MFLLTGLPRSRTAWFAALFNAVGVETIHDWAATFGSWSIFKAWFQGERGWCDPCAACVHPTKTIELMKGHKVVIVTRALADSYAAYAKWDGSDDPEMFVQMTNNYKYLRRTLNDAMEIEYAELNSFFGVQRVVYHCTGLVLSRQLYDTFNLLKIEQHKDKARAALPTGDLWQ